MPLTDIILKLVDGIKLPPREREELRLAMLDTDRNRIETGAWIGEGSRAVLKGPSIFDPDFRTSPLHVFHCYLTTDATCTNNVWKTLTFDTGSGDLSIFDFWQNDKSKLRIDRAQFNVTMDGFLSWDNNTTGDRVVRIRVFDTGSNQLASQELSGLPTVNSAGFTMTQNFAYTENIRGIFPEVAYMQLEAFQNSGGDLNIHAAVLSLRIA